MANHNPPPGMVKMTINIPPELKRRLKGEAARREVYIQDLVIEAIEKELRKATQ